jgi:hypothetical protein
MPGPSIDRSDSLLERVLPAARNRFLAAYGEVDHDTLLRARVLALSLNATLATYARTERMSELEAETLDGIERILAEQTEPLRLWSAPRAHA